MIDRLHIKEDAIRKDWLRISEAVRMIGVSESMLRRWRLQGWVKCVKDGDFRQSTVLYCTSDINRALAALALGRRPVFVYRAENDT